MKKSKGEYVRTVGTAIKRYVDAASWRARRCWCAGAANEDDVRRRE